MRRRIALVLDWDGTITKSDTLHLVAGIGYAHRQQTPNSNVTIPTWTELGDGYLARYKAHESAYQPPAAARTGLEAEAAWLESLRPVEQWSVDQITAIGLFNGVTATEVKAAAADALRTQAVQLRRGLMRCALYCNATGGQVSVLSVNWSAAFIKACLEEATRLHAHSSGSTQNVERLLQYARGMAVEANELILGSRSSLVVRTSADKLRLLRRREAEARAADPKESDEQAAQDEVGHLTVYVGDSDTDLESLVAADVGICIQDDPLSSSQSKLAQTLERLGYVVRSSGQLTAEHIEYKTPCLWSARNFDQVHEALQRLTQPP